MAAEKKYTIKEIVGFATAACTVLGIGVGVAPKAEVPTQYMEAQAVRDSIKTEEFRALKSKVDRLGDKLDSSYRDLRTQNDSVKWALKSIASQIDRQSNTIKYGYACDNSTTKIARGR